MNTLKQQTGRTTVDLNYDFNDDLYCSQSDVNEVLSELGYDYNE